MHWFKHYSDAGQGRYLNHVMDEFGPTGYAWYFLLLELCAEKWDGKSEPKFSFHETVVRSRLRGTVVRIKRWLDHAETMAALRYCHREREFQFDIPKLLEIKSSRNVVKNSYPQASERSRVQKKNKSKNKSTYVEGDCKAVESLPKIALLWNQHKASCLPEIKAMSKSSNRRKSANARWQENPNEQYWTEVINRVNQSKYCTGLTYKAWKANFEWFVRPDKSSEILEGRYDKIFEDTCAMGNAAVNQVENLIANNPFRKAED